MKVELIGFRVSETDPYPILSLFFVLFVSSFPITSKEKGEKKGMILGFGEI